MYSECPGKPLKALQQDYGMTQLLKEILAIVVKVARGRMVHMDGSNLGQDDVSTKNNSGDIWNASGQKT